MTNTEKKRVPHEPFEVIGMLLSTARMHRKEADRHVSLTGLHPTRHRVLMYLSRKGGSLKQKEIAERFELTPAAVAQTLDKLEEMGYVRRVSSESDGRCNRIELTEKGLETAEESAKAFEKLDRRLLAGISEEEIDVFCAVLAKMQENHNEGEGGRSE